jgi:hypothetical protein
LYYLQSRYYNPEWGRFINADAYAGKPGKLLSHNVFAYCMNNPVNMYDPDGRIAIVAAFIAAPFIVKAALVIATALTAVYTYHTAIEPLVSGISDYITYANSSPSRSTPSNNSSGSGGNGSPEQSPKKPRKPTDGHHSYLKALGGAASQKLVEIAPELHQKVHSALYKFENGWLAPKRGYTGKMIWDLFSAKTIQDGLTRFYNSNEEFKIFIQPLKEAIKFTGK